jgi:general secretion pathway protein D
MLLLATSILSAGCAAGKAFRQGETAARGGDFDSAVVAYRKAVQADPENPNYKIALQRAMLSASRAHFERAQEFEEQDQLEAALGEYRLASEYDPSNRLIAAKVVSIDRTVRERLEAARPRPPIEEMRERARASIATPTLINFTTPLRRIQFVNASLRDILNLIAGETGINVLYDREVQDRSVTVQLDGVTLEQALNQILSTNQLSYKVLSERSILVFNDTVQKHNQYDEQVVQTFYLSTADPTELTQILSGMLRLPQMPIQPAIAPNRANNSITVRGTLPVVQILERIIEQNDKPRAEIVIDVEILEVDRSRAKSYGLNLTEYAIGGIFSPEAAPRGAVVTPIGGGAAGGDASADSGQSTPPGAVISPPVFNLNTISQGLSVTDFYLAVPAAIVRFLESDTHTKVLAKPQLRGAEGTKLTLKLGQRIPVVSTAFTPIAGGGAAVNPLASYQYSDVGINLDMTPRVTPEGDILLDITIDDSAVGPDKSVAGTTVPTFTQRTLTTRLRLRDGESNLLAGLLQETEQSSTSGFLGATGVPILRDLFSGNTRSTDQTDIIMLLTPHIIRPQEITEDDLRPLFIGSQGALGLGGPPPLIASPPEPEAAPAAPSTPAPRLGTATPPGAISSPTRPAAIAAPPLAGERTTPPGSVVVPPGSSPVPGTVTVPPPAPAAAPPAAPAPEPQVAPPPVESPQAPPAAPPPAPEPPITSPGVGMAQVTLTPPGTPFRVGQGPYTVPISITGAQRISTITLTVTFDPARLRVRAVQEGSFLRTGGAEVTFTQQAGDGRIDVTMSRGADATGASGTGLLAAVLFDAVAPGDTTLTVSGAATGPGGTAMGLQFRPVTVAVQ